MLETSALHVRGGSEDTNSRPTLAVGGQLHGRDVDSPALRGRSAHPSVQCSSAGIGSGHGHWCVALAVLRGFTAGLEKSAELLVVSVHPLESRVTEVVLLAAAVAGLPSEQSAPP